MFRINICRVFFAFFENVLLFFQLNILNFPLEGVEKVEEIIKKTSKNLNYIYLKEIRK